MRELDDLDTFSPLPSAPVMPSSPSADAAARRSIRDLRGASFSSEMSDLPTSEAEEHTIEQEPSNIPEDHSSSTLSDSATSDHDTSTASSEQRSASDDGPLTPKASSFNLAASTHAQAPNTIAVDQSRRFLHPAVPATASAAEKLPRPPRAGLGSSMALKEQSNLVDRLSKENWGLKMRIHFLDQDLAKLSREGTDNMISENASLKLDVFRLQKDNKDLRKKIRILESNGNKGKIGERSPDRIATPDGGANASVDQADLVILRERIETYEIEIKKLREESIARESEKRQLAEMVKALNERKDSGASDVSAREERVCQNLVVAMPQDLTNLYDNRIGGRTNTSANLRDENMLKLRASAYVTNSIDYAMSHGLVPGLAQDNGLHFCEAVAGPIRKCHEIRALMLSTAPRKPSAPQVGRLWANLTTLLAKMITCDTIMAICDMRTSNCGLTWMRRWGCFRHETERRKT